MARRSPLNERYQKNTAPAGKTRKSAAAAKPKRDAGTAASSKSSSKARTSRPNEPQTPEYKRIRKLWWWLLGSSMIVTLLSLAIQNWTPYDRVARVMLGIGYTLIFYAIYLDWTKIRRMRKEWVQAGRPTAVQAQKAAKPDADKPAEKGAGDSRDAGPDAEDES